MNKNENTVKEGEKEKKKKSPTRKIHAFMYEKELKVRWVWELKTYMEEICCFSLFVCTKFAIPIFIGPCKWYTNRCAENLNTCIAKGNGWRNFLSLSLSLSICFSFSHTNTRAHTHSTYVYAFSAQISNFVWCGFLFHFILLVFRSLDLEANKRLCSLLLSVTRFVFLLFIFIFALSLRLSCAHIYIVRCFFFTIQRMFYRIRTHFDKSYWSINS